MLYLKKKKKKRHQGLLAPLDGMRTGAKETESSVAPYQEESIHRALCSDAKMSMKRERQCKSLARDLNVGALSCNHQVATTKKPNQTKP